MLFRKELQGKEIIDRDGNTVGLVDDLDITEKGRVIRITAIPTGIVSRFTRERLQIGIEDIDTISHLVMLKKSEEELRGVFKCKACGQAFESEEGRKLHYSKEHSRHTAMEKIQRKRKSKKRRKK